MKTFRVKKTTVAVSLLIGGILMSSSVVAQTGQFILSNSASASSAPVILSNSTSSGKLVQIGEARGSIEPLKGFAKDLPLLTVLKQITPNGWVVKKNDSGDRKLDIQQLVSWSGGQSWVATLADISQRHGINTLVNWNTQEITVSPIIPSIKKDEARTLPLTASATPRSTSGVFELSAGTPVVQAPQTQVIEKGAALPPPIPTTQEIKPIVIGNVEPVIATPVAVPVANWTLVSTKTLKENVEEWGKSAGYRVVWNGDDYPVDQNRTLTGEFDAENGPVKQLALDYAPESRVQQPLAFQFYQNRTLVIENLKFEQQGFPQYTQ